MTINGNDYYDPNLPMGADLVELGIEEPPKYKCQYYGELDILDENDMY